VEAPVGGESRLAMQLGLANHVRLTLPQGEGSQWIYAQRLGAVLAFL